MSNDRIKDYFLIRSVQPVHCSGFLRSSTAFCKKCAGSFFRSLWICGGDHSAWDDHGGSTDRCVSQEFFHGCDPQSALPDAGFLSFYVSDWICVPKPADESMCFWGRRLCCHAFSWAVQCDFIDLHATGSPRIYDRKDQCVFHGSSDSHDTSRTVFVRTDSRSRYFGSRVVSFCISGKPWDCMFCKTGNKKELRNFKKSSCILYLVLLYYHLSERCGCSSMVELQPSKLITWVRFPSPAYKNY